MKHMEERRRSMAISGTPRPSETRQRRGFSWIKLVGLLSFSLAVALVLNVVATQGRQSFANREPDSRVLGKSSPAGGQVLGLSVPISEQNIVFRLRSLFLAPVEMLGLTVQEDTNLEGSVAVGGSAAFSQDVQVAADLDVANTVTASQVVADNILYGLEAGSGVSISDGQTPSVSLNLNTFASFEINGDTIEASGLEDVLEFENGDGVNLDVDGSQVTISADGEALNVSGWSGTTTIGAVVLAETTDQIGIGTDTPTAKLDVVSTSDQVGLRLQATTGQTQNLFEWTDSSGTVLGVIDETGQLGIGTTNPSSTLHVVGTTTITSGINNSNGGIVNAGAITGATGITSSGTITYTDLGGAGIVKANAIGILSSGLLDLSDTANEVTGVVGATSGGTGLSSYTTGDILYASGTNTLATLGVGGSGQVLTVDSGGSPTWASITGGGGLCTNCVVTDPGSDQVITPSIASATGLIVRQAAGGTADVFAVTNNDGSEKFLQVDSAGNVVLGDTSTTGAAFSVAPSGTDPIAISPVAAGANQYTGSITSQDLTADRTWTLPDVDGTVCLTSGNCAGVGGLLGGSGTTNYIPRFDSSSSITNSVLYQDGNQIGIGTTSPTSDLTVSGSANTTGALTVGTNLEVLSDTQLQTLTAAGAVVINSTLDVGSNLTVAGTADITGNSSIDGTLALGTSSAGAKLHVVGDILVEGVETTVTNANVTTSYLKDSIGNIFIYQDEIWNGSAFVATDNYGVGHGALGNNSGGNSGGFGDGALQFNSGDNSNGFGQNALHSNSGDNSNGFGYLALYNNSGARSNGFGYFALRSNSGDNSNGFGFRALRRNSGNNNTAFGHAAGYDATYSLLGANNTFLGANSTYDTSAMADSTITNATAVGANITLTDSNTVILGNGASVGIGTTNPAAKLDILGSSDQVQLAVEANATQTANIFEINSNGGSGGDLFVVDDEGRVGIGTTSPLDLLHITKSSNLRAYLVANTGTSEIQLGNSIGGSDRLVIGYNSLGYASLQTASGTYPITLQPNGGNVTIGGTSNLNPLQVINNSDGTRTTALGLQNNGSTTGTGISIDFYNSNSTVTSRINSLRTNQDTAGDTDLIFSNFNNSTLTENLRLTSNGSLGIGTTTPAAKLDILGSSDQVQLAVEANATQTANIFEINSNGGSGGDLFVVDDAGNVGIGEISPDHELHVEGSIRANGPEGYYLNSRQVLWLDGVDDRSVYFRLPHNGAGNSGFSFRDWDSNQSLFFIRSNGNVGIGTTSPTAKLDILGSSDSVQLALEANATQTANIFEINSDGGSGGDRFVVDDAGNVGIGTTSPQAQLHLRWTADTGAPDITLDNGGDTGGNLRFLMSRDGTTSGPAGGFDYDVAAADLEIVNYYNNPAYPTVGNILFRTEDIERVRISRTGNVGIGTVDPSSALEVNGSILSKTGSIRTTGSYVSGQYLIAGENQGTTGVGYLQLVGNQQKLGFKTGGVEVARIDEFGNLGIGTTSPTAKLDILGSSDQVQFALEANATQTANIFEINSNGGSGGDLFVVDDAGNVGIGTTNPTYGLTNYGTFSSNQGNITIGGTSEPILEVKKAGVARHLLHADSTSYLGVANNNIRIGIGTTNPASKLHIDNNTLTSLFRVSGGGGNFVEVTSTGSVGIGTTSPAALLHVKSSASRSASGQEVLRLAANQGSGDPGSGAALTFGDSGTAVVGKIVSAAQSDAGAGLGFWTMNNSFSVTEKVRITGSGSLGIGTTAPSEKLHVAGSILVEGTESTVTNANVTTSYLKDSIGNIFIYQDEYWDGSAFAATNNYGVGHGALENNSGIWSNGFGYYALQDNSGGNSNGFGYEALRNNSGGNSNGFGFRALWSNSGSSSNGFGHQALWFNSGSNSNGFGHQALWFNSGSNSNGFGHQALQNNSGANNTAIGHQAGYDATYELLGADNTFLGANSTYDTSAMANSSITNATAVGANITLTDSNTVILGNGANVGIGTTAPAYKLDVAESADTIVAQFSDNDASCTIDPDVAGGISCTSDQRKKKDIASLNLETALSDVLNLRPVSYHMTGDSADQPLKLGFIAQEVAAQYPSLVTEGADGYLSLNYAGLTPVLTAAIQQQQVTLDTLAGQGQALSLRVDQLEQLNPASSQDTTTQAAPNPLLEYLQPVSSVDLPATADPTVGSIQWVAQVLFQAPVWFQDQVTFLAEAVFGEPVLFQDQVEFYSTTKFAGQAEFSQPVQLADNQVGQAVIPAGQTEVSVTFSEPYNQPPVVMLTLATQAEVGQLVVLNTTSSGFSVGVSQAQAQDVLVNWQAFLPGQAAVAGTSTVSSQNEPTDQSAIDSTEPELVSDSPSPSPSSNPESDQPATSSAEVTQSATPSPEPEASQPSSVSAEPVEATESAGM